MRKHAEPSTVIINSSNNPYTVAKDENDDGTLCSDTFTENWTMKTETMADNIKIPVNVTYDDNNLFQLDLYLPDKTTNKAFRKMKPENMGNLWLFFDNDDFIIIYPEFIDPYFDQDGFITRFRLKLGNTAFHSELKALREKYSPEEICNLVCNILTTSNITEIYPRIVCSEDETLECPTVFLNCKTAPTLKKTITAIRKS